MLTKLQISSRSMKQELLARSVGQIDMTLGGEGAGVVCKVMFAVKYKCFHPFSGPLFAYICEDFLGPVGERR